jgi:D-beta-D-heptose 7-phosphate kinase/D-beta-D-heptose 1-phosphate adenosyltransferase
MIKIFVNGCFDILHVGHISLLNHARSLGDYLLVAIDADSRVRESKGTDRPINNQATRSIVLQNLKSVDRVEIFHSDQELIDIVQNYLPDVMVVGSDWRNKKVIGAEYSKSLVFYDRIHNESTTKIIENYLDRRYLSR